MFPQITPLPPAPSRSDLPEVFIPKADAFVAAQGQFGTELNAAGAYIDTQIGTVDGAASTATAAATSAGQANALAQQAAQTAINAPGTRATSVTPLTIATGAITFTMNANKEFGLGQTVSIALTSDASKRMIGVLTAYNATTGAATVLVDTIFGAATLSQPWTIALSAPGSIPIATAADIWAGTDNGKAVTAAAQAAADLFQTLNDNTTISWNTATQGYNAQVTLGGNRTMGLPSNLRAGRPYALIIKQDATGGRTIVFPSNFKFGAAGAPVLSTAPNAIDVVRFQVLEVATPILDAQFKKIG